MMNLHTAVGWQGWQRKRKQQDVQYTLLFANHQVSAATTSKKQSCTGACRSGTLPCRLLGSERAVQKTEAQLAGGWEPEAMDCHWSREACSKLLGTSSDVCLRDLSTLAALFVGIQAAKTVALSPGELHAPPMAGGIRQSFWQGASSPSPAEAQSRGHEESGQDCSCCRIEGCRTADSSSLCLSVCGHPLGFPGGFGWLQLSKDMYSASPATKKLSRVLHEIR